MKLDLKKAQELAKNSEFISALSQVCDDKERFIDLFKQQGIDISEKEYKEILKSKEELSQCSEEELEKISGGLGDVINVYSASPRVAEPMSAIGGVVTGGIIWILGAALTLHSACVCATKGPFHPL